MSGILRRDPGSEDGEDNEDDYQHRARGRQRVVAGGAGERDGEGGQDQKSLRLDASQLGNLPDTDLPLAQTSSSDVIGGLHSHESVHSYSSLAKAGL